MFPFFILLYQYLTLPFLSICTQCIQAEYKLPHGRDNIKHITNLKNFERSIYCLKQIAENECIIFVVFSVSTLLRGTVSN